MSCMNLNGMVRSASAVGPRQLACQQERHATLPRLWLLLKKRQWLETRRW